MVVVAAHTPAGGGGYSQFPNTEEGASHGAQSHNTVVSNRFASFRVSWGAQSRNFGCANNTSIVCHAVVVCYCVSCGNARNRLMHALCTPKKAL